MLQLTPPLLWQMVPAVLLIPFNADLRISLAVQRFLSLVFSVLQLELSGRSGVAMEVPCHGCCCCSCSCWDYCSKRTPCIMHKGWV